MKERFGYLFFMVMCLHFSAATAQNAGASYVMVIHGGAGTILI